MLIGCDITQLENQMLKYFGHLGKKLNKQIITCYNNYHTFLGKSFVSDRFRVFVYFLTLLLSYMFMAFFNFILLWRWGIVIKGM